MIKITPADSWFSRCVRARANWTCERCQKQYPPNSQGLHCSHFIGRGNWSVRFDPLNALALCYGCHMHIQGNPIEHRQLIESVIGENGVDMVITTANCTQVGRMVRKTKGVGEIAKHYRSQLIRMQREREEGKTLLSFGGWQ